MSICGKVSSGGVLNLTSARIPPLLLNPLEIQIFNNHQVVRVWLRARFPPHYQDPKASSKYEKGSEQI